MPISWPYSNQEASATTCAAMLAHELSQKFGSDLNAVLHAMRIGVHVAPHDSPGFPLPRLAVWEGDTRIIRLFQLPLVQKFSDWPSAACRACAHELFHALFAEPDLLFPAFDFPLLSRAAEETAAQAFAEIVARNFRLTLDSHLLNF